jgi:hypothetical protein
LLTLWHKKQEASILEVLLVTTERKNYERCYYMDGYVP